MYWSQVETRCCDVCCMYWFSGRDQGAVACAACTGSQVGTRCSGVCSMYWFSSIDQVQFVCIGSQVEALRNFVCCMYTVLHVIS